MQTQTFSLRQFAVLFALCAVALLTAGILGAWTGPTATPPAGNVTAPINEGRTTSRASLQTKHDQLSVYGLATDALAVFGNTILSGSSPRYFNFGSTAGSAGYGFRDNGGTLEYKDSGGDWKALASFATVSCAFNGQSIAHGGSVTGYQSSSVAYGSQCVSEQRICTNGTLSGTYQYSSCTVSPPASCTFNGQTIAHGAAVTAYQVTYATCGSCPAFSQQRTCTNGTLSGSYPYSSCSEASCNQEPIGGDHL